MLAYHFDTAGMYQGATEADESPLEPGVYHFPARSTAVPPPDRVPLDKGPRWNGAAWEVVNRPQVTPANDNDPLAKLAAFLSAHPDVAAMLQSSNGGANE